jgi:hypothetical protein
MDVGGRTPPGASVESRVGNAAEGMGGGGEVVVTVYQFNVGRISRNAA